MLVRDYQFRSLLNKVCYIEGKPNAVVLSEFLSDDTTTGFVGYAYIDHQAGLTFEVLACATKKEEDIIVYPGNDYMTFKYRARTVMGNEIVILEDTQYDKNAFQKKIDHITSLYNKDVEIEALRDIIEIDGLRSNEFPDDVLVTLYKEDVKPERAWFRLEGFNENYIQGTLLHELTKKDYKLQTGDVCNLALMQDEEGKISIICFVE